MRALNRGPGTADGEVVTTGLAPRRLTADEHGFGLLSVVLSLVVLGVMGAGAALALGGSGGAPGAAQTGLGTAVDRASDVGAQSTLQTVAQNVLDASVANGGFTGLDLSQYRVVSGPSSSSAIVSGVVGGADSATLAVLARTGTCWFAWVSSGASWYGAQVHASSCQAVALAGPPTPGSSSGAVTWQAGSFPTT